MLLITYLPIIRYYKKHYNIAERIALSDWLMCRIHLPVGCMLTSVCLHFCGNLYFLFSSTLPVVILQFILLLKTWKHLVPLLELPNFDLNLFGTPPSKSAKRFANLSERELNHMVEQRHSEKTKKTTNWSVSTFRGKPSIVTIPQCFPAILWHTT